MTCVQLYTHSHTHAETRMHTSIHVQTRACMCANARAHMHTYMIHTHIRYGIIQVANSVDGGCAGGCKSGGQVVTAVFAVVSASLQLGQLSPGLTAPSRARGAALGVFDTLDRRLAIDIASGEGLKPAQAHGELHL